MNAKGDIQHQSFLDISGSDPSRAFAEALIAGCGEHGPVFVYNVSFERGRITALAQKFTRLRRPLMNLAERLVDLLPIARTRYYHPHQQGSWSIKSVLPTIAPDLGYDSLDGIKDGGMAASAYLEAIDSETTTARKTEIERQLTDYCQLDTFAMVRLWQFFTGRSPSPIA